MGPIGVGAGKVGGGVAVGDSVSLQPIQTAKPVATRTGRIKREKGPVGQRINVLMRARDSMCYSLLDTLNEGGNALSNTNAHGGQAVLATVAFHAMQ
jgi:hypothetical protein